MVVLYYLLTGKRVQYAKLTDSKGLGINFRYNIPQRINIREEEHLVL